MTDIIFVDNVSDLKILPLEKLQNENVKIFSFDMDSHLVLREKKIKHEPADNLLNQEERFQLFDKMNEFMKWYSKLPSTEYEFAGVNILKIFDSHEFQSYILPNIIKLITIKKIIENEKPTKIIATSILSQIIESIIQKQNIETEFFQNTIIKQLLWQKITFKYNLGSIPLTFSVSRNTYLKIKNLLETVTGFLYGFWFNINSTKKKYNH